MDTEVELKSRRTTKVEKPAKNKKILRIIRRRAYELYEQRGRAEGHAEEDWLQAEAEIVGSVSRSGVRE